VPFLAGLLDEIHARYPRLESSRVIHELVRRVITRFVEDVVAESERRLFDLQPADADAIRHAGRPLIGFSTAYENADKSLKSFLYPNMYRHRDVMRVRIGADRVVRDLFARLVAEPGLMPREWADGVDALDGARRARRVADYIAGMTDRYALAAHRRLFDVTPELR
jgi:dGTPase